MRVVDFAREKGIRGAIFDMDGTLTSSMSKWNEIYGILFDRLGIDMPKDFTMRYNHIAMQYRAEAVIKDFALNFSPREVYAYWLNKTLKYYENEFKVKPYMADVLSELNKAGIIMAIVTASDTACAKAFIKSNEITRYFKFITGLNEVSRPKSFPDIYSNAAKKLGVKPEECIVFEDALTAVKSAKSGGFYVCGVQDDCSASDANEIKAIADISIGF